MNQIKKAVLVSLSLMGGLSASSVFAIGIEAQRCSTWGDSLDQGAPVDIRFNYAMRCGVDPRQRSEIVKAYLSGIRQTAGVVTKGYPIYGVFAPVNLEDPDPFKNPAKWFAPSTPARANENCNSVLPNDGLKPANYEVFAVCASGCYTPDQTLLVDPVAGTTANALSLYQSKATSLAALSEQSTFSNVSLKPVEIDQWITDAKSGNQKILHFKTLSGGSLKVTVNHPLVNEKGEIEEASQFTVGRALVKVDGSLDPITEIISENYFGKVYNFDSNAQVNSDRIFVAEGFLNGSLYFQNQDIAKINRLILRNAIAENLIQTYGNP